ncbi:MAG: CHAT domain-containing protein [Bacteroidota bacterium]
MNRFLLFLALTVTMLLCFSRNQQTNPLLLLSKYLAADRLYRNALSLSAKAGDNEILLSQAESIFRQAQLQFNTVLQQSEASGNDSLLFFTLIKTGYIHNWLDSTAAARKDYQRAIIIKQKLPAVPDSFLFAPLLYTGGIYYSQNQFDSSLAYYKRAEEINDSYFKPLHESQRLYNRLGAMHYETGNYRQAKNYFEKAISLTSPSENALRANYQVNIASMLLKSGEPEQAKAVYENLLPLNVFTDEIYQNLGIISLQQQDYKKAAGYFSKVNYSDKKNIDLYYNRAMACSGLNESDSAGQYLHKALAENLKWNGHRKNVAYGLILKYQGDELAVKQQYKQALPFYQQAIMQFDNNFSEPDASRNPEQFSRVFSYINLFNTLAAKGDALEKLYQQEKDLATLVSALSAYRSAFSLADYVERTYNSDEARLFLGKIKHAAHSRPIDIGIQLYQLTQKREYLEEVYFFDQRNKASVLSLNVKMQELAATSSGADDLYQRESTIKSAITRFSLKAASQTDSAHLAILNASIRDLEIELDKIRAEISADPQRSQLLAAEKIPAISQLQRKLDKTTALLSFHLSEENLLVLVITPIRFEYYQAPVSKKFFTEIESLKASLYQSSAEQRYTGAGSATWLYQQLLAPLLPALAQTKRLIIIPDDELYHLPFEALQDENRNYLLQKFSIQYQYSAALLGGEGSSKLSGSVLSFAPFAGAGYRDSSVSLSRLPASAEEVQQLNGKNLLDTAASKENFISLANHYPVLHLATHASVNNENPQRSFISFWPGNVQSRLYAQEIYDLKLDSTELIILSACETGAGQLVKGEGLMSLSRAFAYAGCPGIITSLWKAEDKTTSFITRRLHYYLSKNESKDQALRLAKLDLMNSPGMEAGMKTPNYWAHLVYIGEYEPDHKRSNWPWVAGGIVIILLGYYYLKRKSLPSSKRQQA